MESETNDAFAVSRLDRAAADTSGLKDVGASIVRAVVGLLLTLMTFSLAGWPDGALGVWLSFAVFVAGFLASAGLQFGFNYLMAEGRIALEEVGRLRKANAELEKNHQDVESLRRVQEQQDAAYQEQVRRQKRATEIVEAHNRVLWGVYREQDAGVRVPLSAVMARLQAHDQAITQGSDVGPTHANARS